jgi:hypothetical protein
VSTTDTGERRRGGDARPLITELIDEATIQSIAEDAWVALVGEDELLVPMPCRLPADTISSWVDVVGPWTGTVVLTTGRQTAADLTNVKAALPGPSALSLPQVGALPTPRNRADFCRVDVLWRGEPLAISVQGALPALPAH